MSLIDLPEDILLLIIPFLEPKEFLSLCSVNKAFYSTLHSEPTYWRVQTSHTFRIPINPLLSAEGGSRWYWLYKKLRTQTVAFSWGSDSGCGALGQPRREEGRYFSWSGLGRPFSPSEMAVPPGVGVIADLQCGGWSTSILTAKGDLWSVGIFDAANGTRLGNPQPHFTKLKYGIAPDEGYPSAESVQPIKQFSSGRRHLLALDESGGIWAWNQIHERARPVEFLTPALIGGKKPIRVIAGWSTSTAFVPEQGIVYWQPPERDQNPFPAINEKVIPHTGYRKPDLRQSHFAGEDIPDTDLSAHEFVGQVLAHVVLENYIVFVTSTSRVFAFRINHSQEPFEITSLSAKSTGYGPLLNIQGSFRRFAVFASTGQVLTCDQAYIENWRRGLDSFLQEHVNDIDPPHRLQSHNILPPPPLIPALQSTQVISLAFGDYHFHALHSTGDISSYGIESASCGSFGLGSRLAEIVRQLRGVTVRSPRPNPQARLQSFVPTLTAQAWRSPRRIWFDRERRAWVDALAEKVREKHWNHRPRPDNFSESTIAATQPNEDQAPSQSFGLSSREWAALSEWVEQQGLVWYDTPPSYNTPNRPKSSTTTTPIHPFFALTISSAGHHSAAILLRDPENNNSSSSQPRPSPVQIKSKSSSSHGPHMTWRERLEHQAMRLPRIRIPGDLNGRLVGQGLDAGQETDDEQEEEDEWPLGIPERVFSDENNGGDDGDAGAADAFW